MLHPAVELSERLAGKSNLWEALFFVKLVEKDGKIAVCGARVGHIFAGRNNSQFLRVSDVHDSGRERNNRGVYVRNLRFFTDLTKVSQNWRKDWATAEKKKDLRPMLGLKPDYRYALGMPSTCKFARYRLRDWTAENQPKGKLTVFVKEKIIRVVRR
ncbi:hypothetical protein [Candidatus Rhodobacter oscarellae]|uniref:hypothetical protein n=1 Tax=Candidatus Rhodobacter oscarellae TaxID=1675527 RepID=UPI00128EF586|nr:hypothetical protein [Candidatus Rhodobacter lobularis]